MLRVYDDLHGLIYFDDDEEAVINLPLFQRLRRIQQLALAHYIFPGATHSRFAHSLGVAQTMQLVLSSPRIKQSKYLSGEDKKHLRMAALLHDLGHLPLSHSLEPIYRSQLEQRKREVEETLGENGTVSALENTLNSADEIHEGLTAHLIIESELRNTLVSKGYSPEVIRKIILGNHEKTCLNQLLHSDLDVDVMDYLRRDAKATGITYGEFALPYLVGNMAIVKRRGGTPLICVDRKALHTVEHFILARYFYYLQLLYHKKRRIYDFLAHIIANWLMKEKENGIPHLIHLDEWVKTGRFSDFDDYYFFTEAVRFSRQHEISVIKQALSTILSQRKIVDVRIDETHRLDVSEEEQENEEIQAIADKASEKADQWRSSNLLEEHEVFEDAPRDDHPRFPLVIEKRNVYPSESETSKKMREQMVEHQVDERDTIKIRRGKTILENINRVRESMVQPLSGRQTVLVRYYYFPKDKVKSLLS